MAPVDGVTKSGTGLSDSHLHFEGPHHLVVEAGTAVLFLDLPWHLSNLSCSASVIS